jgi:hypothetical protein
MYRIKLVPPLELPEPPAAPAVTGDDVMIGGTGERVFGARVVGSMAGTDGAVVVREPQMVNPALLTLASETQAIEVPAVTGRLLIWAFVWRRVVEVPIVK